MVRSCRRTARPERLSWGGEIKVCPRTTWDNETFRRHAEGALFADPHISLTSRGGIISGTGLISDSVKQLQAEHLRGTRQLGNITDIALIEGRIPRHFRHTRFAHVSLTAIFMDIVAKRNGLSWPKRYAQRLRAARHDDLIGPGGDALKLVDPVRFNEDRDFARITNMVGWGELRRRYRFSSDFFLQYNPLQDSLDRATYTLLDARGVVRRYSGLPPQCRPAEYDTIVALLEKYPRVCDIAPFVELWNGLALITDPERYGAMAMLRALMFRSTYYNPLARVEEHFIGSLILSYVYRRNEIPSETLCRMTDSQLEAWIGERISIPNWRAVLWLEFQPVVHSFATRAEAETARNALLAADPRRTILMEEWRGATKPATDILVRAEERILPFREARPEEALRIEATIHVDDPWRLYSFKIDFAAWPLLWPFVEGYNRQFDTIS